MDSQASRVPNLVDRIQVPSRSSSLCHTSGCISSLDENSNCPSSLMQAEARTEGQTLASTGHPVEPLASGRTHIAAHVPAAGSVQTTGIPNFSRVLSPANDPPMAPRTRSRSGRRAGVMRNTTRQEKVKRWEGKTKTVSNWDGLRRVGVFPKRFDAAADFIVSRRIPSYGLRTAIA